ncbi:MAG: RraA family protein [Clostridiales Family XIII bacterium]|jgi:RraA family protein|nr:RraA family protein [Clostridiales Family XIII bacterium]
MQGIGFRVSFRWQSATSLRLADALAAYPTANIADNRNRTGCMSACIRPVNKRIKTFAGLALTVKTRAGDNLMVHKALDMAAPGDVVVIDAGGDLSNAILGELILLHAKSKGIRGIVVDGAIRDYTAISEGDLPVYAKGITANGPYKDGPGEVNFPISCGGVTVCPGDIIVGDADSVLVISPEEAQETLDKSERTAQKEEQIMELYKRGNAPDRGWVDKLLRDKGCAFIYESDTNG